MWMEAFDVCKTRPWICEHLGSFGSPGRVSSSRTPRGCGSMTWGPSGNPVLGPFRKPGEATAEERGWLVGRSAA